MPDQTLQDELALRAQAQDPTLNAPWKQAARQGIDFGMGLTGLGDQGPSGPTATNAGALLGAALPVGTLPEDLIRTLMKMPRTSAPEATGKLLGLLNSFKGASGDELKQAAMSRLGGDVVGGNLPQPTRFNQIYRNLVNHVPEAADSLTTGVGNPANIRLARPPGFADQVQREGRVRALFNPSPDTQLQKLMIDRAARPSVTDPADLQLAAQNGVPADNIARPSLSGKTVGSASNAGRRAVLLRAGLTEDAVRNLRSMDIGEAQKLYPSMSPITLKHIMSGDSYSWIK